MKGQLTTIDGYYLDDDAEVIYTSQRNLKMNFNKGLLTSFEIAGTQKVLFTDTTPIHDQRDDQLSPFFLFFIAFDRPRRPAHARR